jgi:hypothetical protein
MANLDEPSGFNPIGKMGSGAPQKMNEYDAAGGYATKIYQGDLVKLNAGNVERGAANDTAFIGVFWGATFDDSDGKPKFINNRPASQAAKVFVYDDPYQVLERVTLTFVLSESLKRKAATLLVQAEQTHCTTF